MREDSPLLGLVTSLLMTQTSKPWPLCFGHPYMGWVRLNIVLTKIGRNWWYLKLKHFWLYFISHLIVIHSVSWDQNTGPVTLLALSLSLSSVHSLAFRKPHSVSAFICQLGQAWTVTHNWSAKSMILLICWILVQVGRGGKEDLKLGIGFQEKTLSLGQLFPMGG